MRESNNRVKHHFNDIANLYDSFKSKNAAYYFTLKHALKEAITKENARIADIGCGTGSVLHFLHPKYGIGTDLSPNMVRIARKKFKKDNSLKFLVHNIEEKPLNGSFDYILFTDVIEHAQNKKSAIKNLGKMMNKKTTLILSMANPFWEPLLMLMEYLKLKMPEGPHERISEKKLYGLLKKEHLAIVSKNIYFPNLSIPFIKNFGLIFIYEIKRIF